MTQRSRPTDSAHSDFEKRLVRYALAGTAILGVPAVSHADSIIFTSVNAAIDTSNSYNANLDGFQTDFTLEAETGGLTFSMIYADALNGTQFVDTAGSYPAALNQGAYIYSGSPTTTNGMLSVYLDGSYKGNWSNTGSPAYLGVVFQHSGGTYYGWAQIETFVTSGGASGELVDFAYNSVAGQGIDAGQTSSSSAAPEPSTLALYALGAAGILALRRRKLDA